jgi:hypothetical protein
MSSPTHVLFFVFFTGTGVLQPSSNTPHPRNSIESHQRLTAMQKSGESHEMARRQWHEANCLLDDVKKTPTRLNQKSWVSRRLGALSLPFFFDFLKFVRSVERRTWLVVLNRSENLIHLLYYTRNSSAPKVYTTVGELFWFVSSSCRVLHS